MCFHMDDRFGFDTSESDDGSDPKRLQHSCRKYHVRVRVYVCAGFRVRVCGQERIMEQVDEGSNHCSTAVSSDMENCGATASMKNGHMHVEM